MLPTIDDHVRCARRRVALMLMIAVLCASSAGAAERQTWFIPMDTITGSAIPSWVPIHGSNDYFDLFKEPSAWPKAASHVQVFGLFAVGAAQMSDDQLRQLVTFTRAHGIKLALEIGMINPDGGCGQGIEGFLSPPTAVFICNRIAAAGGELTYVEFDEPFYFASLYEGPQACRWDADTVARHVYDTLRAMRGVFPRLIGGDIEVIVNQPSATNPDVSNHIARYAEWIDTWRRVSGEPLGFFHTDVNWGRSDWQQQVAAMRHEVEARGIPFGMIYNGGYDMTSDAAWVARAEQHMTDYEEAACRPPDHALFESWDVYPKTVLPETNASTFTALINRYFRQRTAIRWTTSGSFTTGALTTESGQPLAGKTVAVTARGSDQGVPYDFVIDGTVPQGAKDLVIGLRMNTECAECNSQGRGTIVVYQITYAENGGPNRIPNSDFSAGMSNWGFSGSGQAKVASSNAGAGKALYVTVAQGTMASLNSIVLQATPGAHYRATFRASVPASATNSGGFMASFTNVARVYDYFESPTIQIGQAVTDSRGEFTVPIPATSIPGVVYAARFDGDAENWPATGCTVRRRTAHH